jgi:anti-sigma regulatory factor (Ser/Thr protein kinase)
VTFETGQRAADDNHGGDGEQGNASEDPPVGDPAAEEWRELGEVVVASAPGRERQAIAEVARMVEPLLLPLQRLEALKTAVGEATMNAMEHGNHYRADLTVLIRVRASASTLSVTVIDHGSGRPIPEAREPDLEAKLAERQPPRGWGLFLIKNLVDDMLVSSDGQYHTIELLMHLEGERHTE